MTQQLILDLAPPTPPTLDNFISGANHAALDALRSIEPGRAIYLWGSAGAGRTHLLKAVGQSGETGKTRYFGKQDSPRAMRELATANSMPYALIAIDDVQHLDDDGQAALFTLYNRWRELAADPQGFALVLTGDRSPLAMPVREDLRTRLGWDLVYRLELLSDEDRAQALRTRAQERGLQLSPEIIHWILTHYDRDMGRLCALVDALDRYSLARHRAMTLPLLKDLLAGSGAACDTTNPN
ncbi:MAG: DnaA regulatory inactivator Hda [Candidimonas sp.]|jgi:DnaA family protein